MVIYWKKMMKSKNLKRILKFKYQVHSACDYPKLYANIYFWDWEGIKYKGCFATLLKFKKFKKLRLKFNCCFYVSHKPPKLFLPKSVAFWKYEIR